ncbi:DUF2933 domain-containing protein [Anaerobacillus sp. MEB173]|uniref:DUF2933 domain-containing protein n=1 Tax=Anaerobacillus sp. MEB173 TaxID=3383345 RepID=UPI003F8E4DAF
MKNSIKVMLYCLGIFLVIGIIFFVIKGTFNPILLLLLICPLLHLFMHRGHNHDNHSSTKSHDHGKH